MQKFVLNPGDIYGRLKIIEDAGTNRFRQGITLVRCECGVIKTVQTHRLVRMVTTSCGCLRAEKNRISRLKHGDTKSKEFHAWQNMKKRCLRPTKRDGPFYKIHGIKVCERWLNSYEHFLGDMGRAPTKLHSIDRINNLGNYEPSNCRWATNREQAINTNKSKSVKKWQLMRLQPEHNIVKLSLAEII